MSVSNRSVEVTLKEVGALHARQSYIMSPRLQGMIAVACRYVVYMGKDKFENEELLKYGFPEVESYAPMSKRLKEQPQNREARAYNQMFDSKLLV
eukprot:2141551-Amphidinium_carterae.1